MNPIAELERRNAEFADTAFPGPVAAVPQLALVVVTCADHRVDPAHVLGLQFGEAAVIRNAGGRVTPALLQTLAIMALAVAAEASPRQMELALVHHTDCGVARAAPHRELMAAYFDIPVDQLELKALTDPDEAVRVDVAALRESGIVPADLVVSGLVYDVETGLLRTVVGPTPLGDFAGGLTVRSVQTPRTGSPTSHGQRAI